jgi:hypothetical protein
VTPTPSITPTPSLGSSPSPSPSQRPVPFGTIRDVAVLDCNGGLHILPGHPLEMNINLRGARHVLNVLGDEIVSHAKCAAKKVGAQGVVCPSLTDEHIIRHFVPSIPMLLNFLEPIRYKRNLPDECMTLANPSQEDGQPVFAQ